MMSGDTVNAPPRAASRILKKTGGESKRGAHSQSLPVADQAVVLERQVPAISAER
jgi:hypothetical protein